MVKILKTLLTLLFLSSLTSPAFANNQAGIISKIETDSYKNSGGGLFTGIKPANNALLPKVVYPYLPNGNIINNFANKDLKNAPDVGAVEAVVLFLAQTFTTSATAGASGMQLWAISTALIVCGLLLSGFLTFQSVAQGKKGPGEAIISYTTKCAICILGMTFVVANIPPALIGICDSITTDVANWFSSSGNATADADLLKTNYQTKMAAANQGAVQIVANAVQSLGTQPDPIRKKVLDQIAANGELQKFMKSPTSNQFVNQQAELDELQGMLKRAIPASAQEINAKISEFATNRIEDTVNHVAGIAHDTMEKASVGKEVQQPVLGEIMKAVGSINISKFTFPNRAVGMYSYIAFTYIGISIWGMGIAALAWFALYSLPDEWQLNGILISGIKGAFGVILTVVLITIYMSASLSYTDLQLKEYAKESHGAWDRVKEFIGFVKEGVSMKDILNEFRKGVGSLLSRTAQYITGLDMPGMIVGLLIFTAPAQAALMIKGGNGIAEHAKSAMHGSGAAAPGAMSLIGMHGGSSGAQLGSGHSMGGILSNRSADPWANLGPSKRP